MLLPSGRSPLLRSLFLLWQLQRRIQKLQKKKNGKSLYVLLPFSTTTFVYGYEQQNIAKQYLNSATATVSSIQFIVKIINVSTKRPQSIRMKMANHRIRSCLFQLPHFCYQQQNIAKQYLNSASAIIHSIHGKHIHNECES